MTATADKPRVRPADDRALIVEAQNGGHPAVLAVEVVVSGQLGQDRLGRLLLGPLDFEPASAALTARVDLVEVIGHRFLLLLTRSSASAWLSIRASHPRGQ